MQKVLIDTDPGDDIDDVLALAFALLRPELDVRAITTVTSGADERASIVRKLLRIVGRDDIPVGAGWEQPLRRLTADEQAALTDNRGYVLNHAPFVKPGDFPAAAPAEDAASLIVRTAEEHAGEIGLVAIGPLTNIAVALRRKPALARQLRWIAMMGGEVRQNRAEHNIAWDPRAAEVVFASGVPLFLGTWDVTRRFVLTPEECEVIRGRGTPLCDALAECIALWWPHKGRKPGPIVYDVAPIIWSFSRDYYTTEPMQVQVETRGEFTTGMTIARRGEPNMDVTVDMRVEAVRELFLGTVCG